MWQFDNTSDHFPQPQIPLRLIYTEILSLSVYCLCQLFQCGIDVGILFQHRIGGLPICTIDLQSKRIAFWLLLALFYYP